MGIESIILIIKNIIDAVLGWIPKIIGIFKNKNLSNKAIVIVDSDTGYQNYWHVGSQNGRPILQIVCNFMVTNITNQSVAIANASLKGIEGTQDSALISVKDVHSRYSGSYNIPPQARTSLSICFIMHPKKMPEKGVSIRLRREGVRAILGLGLLMNPPLR